MRTELQVTLPGRSQGDKGKDWSVRWKKNQEGVMPWKPREETVSRRR